MNFSAFFELMARKALNRPIKPGLIAWQLRTMKELLRELLAKLKIIEAPWNILLTCKQPRLFCKNVE
jgi:hypothetical protein